MESRIKFIIVALLCYTKLCSSPTHTVFVENKGQHTSTSSSEVLFTSKSATTTLYFFRDKISMVTSGKSEVERIDVLFDGVQSNVLVQGRSTTTSVSNYYIAGSAYEGVKSFDTIVYQNMYPDIDAVFSGNGNNVSLQFILRNNADASLIRFHFNSPSATIQNIAQSLVVNGKLLSCNIHQAQTHEPLFAMLHSQPNIQFRTLPKYFSDNRTKNSSQLQQPSEILLTLITMATYLGGSGFDSTTAAVSDAGAGMIMCGITNSTNYPTTSGVHQQNSQGGRDAFVTKLDAGGNKVWSTYFGGNGEDIAYGIARQSNGTVAIAGSTTSKNGFTTSGAWQGNFGGGETDGFVATINGSNGVRLATTYIGGSDVDFLTSITTKGNDVIAVCGTTLSSDITATAHQANNNGQSEAIITVLNTALAQRVWSSFYGGRGSETGSGVAYLSDGSLIVAGNSDSPNSGSRIAANTGEGSSHIGVSFSDGFLVRFDNNGNRIWGRYYGGDNSDSVTALTIANDIIYIAGYTNSKNTAASYIATSNSVQGNKAGGEWDGFVASFRTDGTRIWGSYHGGDGDDRCTALAPAANGDVFVCGYTNSTTFPIIASDQKKVAGGFDAFLAYYVASGTKRLASAVVGGSKDDFATGIARMNDGTILLCGSTNSTDFPTQNAAQNSNAGNFDAFIVKFIDLTILDVNDNNSAVTFSVNPNPTLGSISISHPEIHGTSTVTISTILGERIYTINNSEGTEQTSIDMSQFANGTYIVTIRSAEGSTSRLVVKE